jgi:hypothetical protein
VLKVEQRVNVKFLEKLEKSATETYNLLMEVYGDERPIHALEESHFTKKKKSMEQQVQFESNVCHFFFQYLRDCSL